MDRSSKGSGETTVVNDCHTRGHPVEDTFRRDREISGLKVVYCGDVEETIRSSVRHGCFRSGVEPPPDRKRPHEMESGLPSPTRNILDKDTRNLKRNLKNG